MDSQTYSDKNLKLLVAISYLMIAMVGTCVILPFVIKEPAVKYFNSTPQTVGYIFSICTTGIIIATFLNSYIVKFVSIRNIIYIISTIYVSFSVIIFFTHSLLVVTAGLFFVGISIGIMDTLPSFIIIHSFNGAGRSTRLNKLDFFFSIGSLTYPFVVSLIMELNTVYVWQISYALIIILFISLIITSGFVKFPELDSSGVKKDKGNKENFSKWNINVVIIGIAVFLYFISYVGFTYWCVEYLMNKLQVSEQVATMSIDIFWVFYAVGCIVASFALRKFKIYKYIMFSASLAFFAYYLIILGDTLITEMIFIALLGYGCSTLFASLVSYGTMQVKNPSPRLIAFFIVSSALADNFGQLYSSYFEKKLSIDAIIVLSSIFMLLVIILVFITEYFRKKNQRYINKTKETYTLKY